MLPVTHVLASWLVVESARFKPRDRALAVWCGVLPDLDGAGLLIDLARIALGRGDEVLYYGSFHRLLLHGLPGAILIPFVLMWFGVDRLRIFLWGVALAHLHLLLDILGSRGPGELDIWPVHYLAPFSMRLTIAWKGQWPLAGWLNWLITLILFAVSIVLARRHGYSIVAAFHTGWDRGLMNFARRIGANLAPRREENAG